MITDAKHDSTANAFYTSVPCLSVFPQACDQQSSRIKCCYLSRLMFTGTSLSEVSASVGLFFFHIRVRGRGILVPLYKCSKYYLKDLMFVYITLIRVYICGVNYGWCISYIS